MLIDKNGNFTYNNFIDYPSDDYKKLKNEALKCNRCHLREGCTQVVMGEGKEIC